MATVADIHVTDRGDPPPFVNPDEAGMVDRRWAVRHWMDRFVDPALVFLALATVPLLIAESADLGPGDRRAILIANWLIYAGFAANFVIRMALADDRRAAFHDLRWDALIVIGQPALALAAVGAGGLGTALVRLAAVLVRTVSRGGILKRTWRTVLDRPIQLLVGGVPFLLLLFSAIVLKAERSYSPDGSFHSIGDALWWGVATMATVGYGDISPLSPIGRVAAGATMVTGIGAFSVLTANLAEFLLAERDRTGHAEADVSGHTLLLGSSPKLATVVRELVIANASLRSADIVVLNLRPRLDIEREITAHVPLLARSSSKLTVRTGSPRDVADLSRVHPETARAVMILDDDPTAVTSTLLALLNGSNPPRPGVPVVAEVRDPGTASALRAAFGQRVQVIEPDHLIARVTAQSCRQPGLGLAYEELLDFGGSELYVIPAPAATVGASFGDLLNAFEANCPVGLIDSDGAVRLAPEMHTVVQPADELVVFALDDSTVAFTGVRTVEPATPADPGPHLPPGPEHVVVVGWSPTGARLLAELDHYLDAGSRITVVVDTDTSVPPPDDLGLVAPVSVRATTGTTYSATLTEVVVAGYDHAVVLAERSLPAVDADARALLAALQIRNAPGSAGCSLVTELLDEADVDLARQVSAGEYIVSNRLASLLMAQLAETPALHAVFDRLLDPAGAELYALPATWYATPGRACTFGAVVESARRRGDIALGYRLARFADDPGHGFGMVLGPAKHTTCVFEPDDRLIVLADPATHAHR